MRVDEKYFAPAPSQATTIEDVLQPDEKILWQGTPNRKSFLFSSVFRMLPIAVIWLCIDLFFIIFLARAMHAGHIPTQMLAVLIPFFLLHLAPVWIWLAGIFRSVATLRNLSFAATDRRIILRSGIIGIDFKFVFYTEIISVNLKVGFFDKLCHVGDVYINADSNSAVLNDIADPYQMATNLQRIVTDMKADVSYPNALRPENNPGYHTSYQDNPFEK